MKISTRKGFRVENMHIQRSGGGRGGVIMKQGLEYGQWSVTADPKGSGLGQRERYLGPENPRRKWRLALLGGSEVAA